ncbi:MAG TPA: hypothetical protein PKN48_02410 [Bacteroidales bacterium]|nr:hypothetical protein [Bacteroidales bacterium]
MKTLIFSCLLALAISFEAYAQSHSSVTIKTITIENGDTTVSERSYDSDGSANIFNDSIFNHDNPFIFFNKQYSLDTNFTENFDRIINREMKDFFQDFNSFSFEMPENSTELFNKVFPPDMDDAFTKDFPSQMIPDSLETNLDDEPSQPARNTGISTENIIFPDKQAISDFSATPGDEIKSVQIIFQLDPKNTTRLVLKDESKKTIYKEKIPKSKGVYTRLFDFKVYPSGIYFLELNQGKKASACRIESRTE